MRQQQGASTCSSSSRGQAHAAAAITPGRQPNGPNVTNFGSSSSSSSSQQTTQLSEPGSHPQVHAWERIFISTCKTCAQAAAAKRSVRQGSNPLLTGKWAFGLGGHVCTFAALSKESGIPDTVGNFVTPLEAKGAHTWKKMGTLAPLWNRARAAIGSWAPCHSSRAHSIHRGAALRRHSAEYSSLQWARSRAR